MGWGSYYLFWFLIPAALALVSAHPIVLAVALVALVARRWIPDPYLFFKHASRVRSLRNQIDLNASNAVARAQLAEIYIDKRRPGRAIPLLEQALVRDPDSADLRYLLGLACLRSGQPEKALEPLDRAVEREPKLRYGSAWLAIGDASAALGRVDEAIAAYQRYVRINSSSVEGYCKLARAFKKKPDPAGAAGARKEALETYAVLPSFQRRKQLLWWVAAKVGG